MKTVVLVWKHKYCNCTTTDDSFFWGIGDMLRGAYGMFNLSQSMNFKLIVDFSLHPLSMILENKEHEYSQLVKEQKDRVPVIYPTHNVISYIEKCFSTSDVVLLYCNLEPSAYNIAPTIELKQFMQSLLTPNNEFKSFIDSRLALIPFPEFSIIHYRLGDDEIVRNNIRDYTKYKQHLLNNIKQGDILISDSVSFKQMINESSTIFSFQGEIGHVGVHTDINAIKNTMFELILISKAKSIRSYSVYGWVSGFVHAIHAIYDIPLICQQI